MTIRAFLLGALATVSKQSFPLLVTKELTLPCTDGTLLAAQQWTLGEEEHTGVISNDNPQNILCIHGWMDNCRSFHHLGPALASQSNTKVVALDLPGHGWSSHKSQDAPPMVQAELAYYISEALHALEWDKCTLIGHSLGAGVCSLFAAAFPEQVDRLILLDGAGFLARKAEDAAKHARAHIVQRRIATRTSIQPPRMYRSIAVAIKSRRMAATKLPGNQILSYEAAEQLVIRATRRADDDNQEVQFCHDARFQWPSIQYMTWHQVEGIFDAVECQVCILLAENGWPFDPSQTERIKELLTPSHFQILPGSHYFHADPGTAEAVVQAVSQFLRDSELADDISEQRLKADTMN
jgi:pimeloyl-ACP methyl ester carboxylesterase